MKKPLTEFVFYYAVFYDDTGDFHGLKRISKNSNTFNYCGRSYVFRPNNSTCFRKNNIFYKVKYYHYNLNNPEPMVLVRNYSPVLTAQQFNTLIESEVLRKLNNLSRGNWLLELFTIRNLIIVAVFVLVYWYLKNNGGALW